MDHNVQTPEHRLICIIPETPEDKSSESNSQENKPDRKEDLREMHELAMVNITKPNVPNINVPERIIICIDICYGGQLTMFRLSDGTSYTPLNMIKRVLEFYINLKTVVSKKTEFALLLLKDDSVVWLQHFTSNTKDLMSKIDSITIEDSTMETFDFKKVFDMLHKVDIPEYKGDNYLLPPPYVVRMIVLYGRSKTVPLIAQEDPFLIALKNKLYFYIDIILAHEEECAENKCEEIYSALQYLDNGYSYVLEVSRNAAKVHDSVAKLLAHPLQRTLQRDANYSFGSSCDKS